MAIDHESPLKEPRAMGRRKITGGDGSEPEEDEVHEDAAGSEEEQPASAARGELGPAWLRALLTASFYTTCEAHPPPPSRRGGETNMFCLDCAAGALCGLCVDHGHRGHRVIQVRRSSYHSVVRMSDVRGLVDMDGVQTYIINGARVVFLNERSLPHNHQHHSRLRGGVCAYACLTCRRVLHDARFCSLGCKVAAGFSCHDDSACYSPSFPSLMSNQSCTPPTPPPTMPLHRRKSMPHRAPFGNLVC